MFELKNQIQVKCEDNEYIFGASDGNVTRIAVVNFGEKSGVSLNINADIYLLNEHNDMELIAKGTNYFLMPECSIAMIEYKNK